jgi:hypothetical protein
VATSDLDTAISNLEARIAARSSADRASGSIEGATVNEESLEDLIAQLQRLRELRASSPDSLWELNSRLVP